jgi:hypothetical protein
MLDLTPRQVRLYAALLALVAEGLRLWVNSQRPGG